MPGLRFLLPGLLFLLAFPCLAEDDAACAGQPALVDSEFLRVVTLNVAHGRKDARNQMFLKEQTIRDNLMELGGLFDRAEADMIALQEADAESRWSGGFNHVEFLVQNTMYKCSVHGIHASNRWYDFGTALLSRHSFNGGFTHSFQPSKPTTTKGFTLAALQWNPGRRLPEPLRVKFVSVHLDFSRRSVRRSQIDELTQALSAIEGPRVVMGDFDTDWQTEEASW